MQCDSDEILVPDSDTEAVLVHLAMLNASPDLYLWKNCSTDDDVWITFLRQIEPGLEKLYMHKIAAYKD